MSIYGWRGDRHDLSKGAFDSTSISKPGTASLLLAENLPKSFDEAFKQLSQNYQSVVGQVEQGSLMNKLWTDYVRPGLKKAGTFAWEAAKPVVMDALMVAAGLNPTAAALVASAETMFSIYLTGLAEPEAVRSVTYNKGQWVFIEKEASLRRRRRLAKSLDLDEKKTTPKVVEFGFYVGAAYKEPHKITVFNMDIGRKQDVDVRAVRAAGNGVSSTADGDETLSVIRELFFYKQKGYNYEKEHPKEAIFPGRDVVFKGDDYVLIQTNGTNALIEDHKGGTKIVEHDALGRGIGKSTPGQGDGLFNKSNGKALYAGQWVMVPSREVVQEQYSVDRELAVIYEIGKGQIPVFHCIDGKGGYVAEKNILVFPPNMQMLYSSKQPFKLFKLAALEGDQEKTSRFELGSKFAQICLNDYKLTVEFLGEDEPTEKVVGSVEEPQIKVGDTEPKTQVDIIDELRNKIHLTRAKIEDVFDVAWEDVEEFAETDNLWLGILAVAALVTIGFAGAATAV